MIQRNTQTCMCMQMTLYRIHRIHRLKPSTQYHIIGLGLSLYCT